MTVFDYDPQWSLKNNHACASVDKYSLWCLWITECINEYIGKFGYTDAMVKYCTWPLSAYQFKQPWNKKERKGYKTYEEYLKSSPSIEYRYYRDQGFYNLTNTDSTLNFAFKNGQYIFIIHLNSLYENYYNECGFGCIIDTTDNSIYCVQLGEDDGNYWGDHDITYNDMSAYEWSLVTAVINDLPASLFWNKELLIEKLFNFGRTSKKQK